MLRVIFAGLAILSSYVSASAQSHSVYKYDSDTINSSIKCELSQVARLFRANSRDLSRMRAHIAISGEEVTSVKAGASIGLPLIFDFRGNYERKSSRLRGAKGNRNIHVDNKVNCRKSFVVDVGILSCFTEQRRLFTTDGQTITCSETTTATSSASADGKFGLWILNAGPSGEVSKTRTWKLDLVAPPEK